jgi:hypothetical protein
MGQLLVHYARQDIFTIHTRQTDVILATLENTKINLTQAFVRPVQ